MGNEIYETDFYENRHNSTWHSAKTILGMLSRFFPTPSSVLDLGCGVGTWLSYFHNRGIPVTGIEGPWVPIEYLRIPSSSVHFFNIQEELTKNSERFKGITKHNLAISLEVAEHIEESLADRFVEFLTTHADYILFSAAIPGQTGDGHVNEQWPSYWAEKFSQYDFTLFDVIRHDIWDDADIPFWYRQNCFLGARKGLLDLPFALCPGDKKFDIVHPKQFEFIQGLYSAQPFWRRVKNKIFG